MAAVRVPPSACSTSQSMAMVFSPSAAEVDARPQRAADEPADLLGAAADLALDRFAVRAGVGGGGQHRVLGGEPAQARALAPPRHALGDAGRAHHAGLAELDQHRSGRMGGEAAGDDYRSQLVVESAVFSSGHPPTLTVPGDGLSDATTSNVSSHTTACTGPSNSALASLMTSSRDVHGGMWVKQQFAHAGLRRGAARLGAREVQVRAAGPARASTTPRTGTRRRRWPVRSARRSSRCRRCRRTSPRTGSVKRMP